MNITELPKLVKAAMREGATALQDSAAHLLNSKEYNANDQVGEIVRAAVESHLINADILNKYLDRLEQTIKDQK
jgi:membrane carboxypeptidase/penicillin-binding protein PbpC